MHLTFEHKNNYGNETNHFSVKLPSSEKGRIIDTDKVLNEFKSFSSASEDMETYIELLEAERVIVKKRSTILKKLKQTFDMEFLEAFNDKFPEHTI